MQSYRQILGHGRVLESGLIGPSVAVDEGCEAVPGELRVQVFAGCSQQPGREFPGEWHLGEEKGLTGEVAVGAEQQQT